MENRYAPDPFSLSVAPASISLSPFERFTVDACTVLLAAIVSITRLLTSALSTTEEVTVSLVTGELVAVT